MRIAVSGTGYVGLSNAVLLAQNHYVVALDVIAEKVEKINQLHSPIADKELEDYLANKPLNLRATLDKVEAYQDAEFVIIATPT
ncbi:UDP-glucose 6-dehydrogenase, partial [Escherichia coli]